MKIFQILILLGSIICSTYLLGDGYKDKHKKYKNNHIYKNLDFLDLDKKQYFKIRDILINYKKKYKIYYQYKEQEESKLQKLVKNNIFDKERYKIILKNIKNKAIEVESTNIEKIHSILNKEQREKFSYYLEEWEVE
jgi:Spy/CpxP family protein refolding chaperone